MAEEADEAVEAEEAVPGEEGEGTVFVYTLAQWIEDNGGIEAVEAMLAEEAREEVRRPALREPGPRLAHHLLRGADLLGVLPLPRPRRHAGPLLLLRSERGPLLALAAPALAFAAVVAAPVVAAELSKAKVPVPLMTFGLEQSSLVAGVKMEMSKVPDPPNAPGKVPTCSM